MDKLKIEKPAAFSGKSDKGEVDTFLYQCELYFEIKYIQSDGYRLLLLLYYSLEMPLFGCKTSGP